VGVVRVVAVSCTVYNKRICSSTSILYIQIIHIVKWYTEGNYKICKCEGVTRLIGDGGMGFGVVESGGKVH
jgi:hypothetical protein